MRLILGASLASKAALTTSSTSALVNPAVDKVATSPCCEAGFGATGSAWDPTGVGGGPPLLKGLNNFSRQIGIIEPIRVRLGMFTDDDGP